MAKEEIVAADVSGAEVQSKLRVMGDRLDKLHIFKWLTVFGIALAAFTFLDTNRNSARQAQFQAWLLLNSGSDVPGNAGRTLALERLAADQAGLERVDLTEAQVTFIKLDGAKLHGANLSKITADYGRFRDADFQETTAIGGNFKWACFVRAQLTDANFTQSHLTNADFRSADLRRAKLVGADLSHAIFDKADLSNADLSGADITGASFRGANLEGAILKDLGAWRLAKDMTGMRFVSARAFPDGFTKEVRSRWNAIDDFNLAKSDWLIQRDQLQYDSVGHVCSEKIVDNLDKAPLAGYPFY